MNWLPDRDKDGNVSKTSIISECRRYRVAGYRIKGELLYEVWEGKRHLAWGLPSSDAAKAIVTREAIDG